MKCMCLKILEVWYNLWYKDFYNLGIEWEYFNNEHPFFYYRYYYYVIIYSIPPLELTLNNLTPIIVKNNPWSVHLTQ